ncbi:uncharacterized protein LOC107833892 [Poecilia formosa]|uniref:uncharacterized protein LOC107833892 n=1 Tax=Poecilia formosa TaxID=48698 RepID=UPI0007B7A87A|nr:PREDICTED: uncharacterized protein LOC107833892 [Poecilia formosa]
MVITNLIKKKFVFLLFFTLLATVIFIRRYGSTYPKSLLYPKSMESCPRSVSKESITPLKNTKHFLVSAFMDQRVQGFDIRLIGMFRRDSIQELHCFFCCADYTSETTPTKVLQHSDNFGFPFVTTDIMCRIPKKCNATHVTLLTKPKPEKRVDWLPIRNKKTNGGAEERMDFTVCISSLFGDYNNVLQFAQTLEMYSYVRLEVCVCPFLFVESLYLRCVLQCCIHDQHLTLVYRCHRMVKQTSVHNVLQLFGQMYKVPLDICRTIHIRNAMKNISKLQELSVDKRLWDFQEKLIPNVDKVLHNSGLLK